MSNLPYVSSPGSIAKALEKIKTAQVPDRVSQDFVKTILGIKGGSGDQITTFLKKMKLANPDGTPTEEYTQFRNPSKSGHVLAQLIKKTYAPLYERNEYVHNVSDEEIKGYITEITGQDPKAKKINLIFSCFKSLINEANFDAEVPIGPLPANITEDTNIPENGTRVTDTVSEVGFNLGYTINLNLPATTDIAVFDAIFKSFRENFLRKEDA